jgi:hypothetical protein
MASLNSTCPKCSRIVTEKDHQNGNVEPAIRQTGPAGSSGIPMQAHWAHKRCPR